MSLAFRNGARTAVEYKPGNIVELDFELWPALWKIKEASRIRVDISSSNFPMYSSHSNTVGPWSLQSETFTAKQSIHMGPKHQSRIILPVQDENI